MLCLLQCFVSIAAQAASEKADFWIDNEFTPSTLTKAEQRQELAWFTEQAKPYQGMTIRVVSEKINTHQYESKVLAKAFYELTGIHVIHELTGEDDVIKKLSAQIITNENLYDAYINDSDLIGTHFRNQAVTPISQIMSEHGKQATLPTLDLDDFIGIKFTTGPDGVLYQLPDQQFANLYWYRSDWFERADFQSRFQQLYGYPLGVPQNWQAYEDIAEFFSDKVRTIDGQRVYGHMDYGKTDPSLGWRMSDAWLSMAGVGDKGLPNGLPVDEWGIRVEDCRPVGASVERGGAINSPAAIYAIDKYVDWLTRFAPPEAKQLTFSQAGDWPAKGVIAQQIFWYTAFVDDLLQPGLPIVNADGTPKWRVAPSPLGRYWQRGMKSGYQDAGAWTFLSSTPKQRQVAAWLYAQFVVSKTVSLKKTLVGYTPIRLSDIESDAMTQRAPYLGGLVEFYRSQARNVWTPTGTNVPDYPGMASMWWQNISSIIEGEYSVKQGMDKFAQQLDAHLLMLEQKAKQDSGALCAPILNPKQNPSHWLAQPGSPKAEIKSKSKGKTLPYEEAIRVWQ
ncbi:carbohydrate ABC transporter substrate-binding protein [Shewanella maritima]|uniref:Carbohydrate ABC transporter substrate-binding protein n=1 Tax=Shewanella maritima TaxID=2520507 RepID=A0A411PMJ8_9GAMM|nr:carbohydrate ABC transporter substrate-binding protein [Shewanella maritima]